MADANEHIEDRPAAAKLNLRLTVFLMPRVRILEVFNASQEKNIAVVRDDFTVLLKGPMTLQWRLIYGTPYILILDSFD